VVRRRAPERLPAPRALADARSGGRGAGVVGSVLLRGPGVAGKGVTAALLGAAAAHARRAGATALYLVTSEEERAIALCRAAAEPFGASVAVWSSARGLDPFSVSSRTPSAALEAVLQAPAPSWG